MKLSTSFWIKLGLLITLIFGLICWPFVENVSNTTGGGSYDLTNLYAGIFILISIIIWTVLILISMAYYATKKNVLILKESQKLLLIGISVFIACFIVLQLTWFR